MFNIKINPLNLINLSLLEHSFRRLPPTYYLLQEQLSELFLLNLIPVIFFRSERGIVCKTIFHEVKKFRRVLFRGRNNDIDYYQELNKKLNLVTQTTNFYILIDFDHLLKLQFP